MVKVTELTMEEYTGRQDTNNANLGTPEGQSLIEGSIKEGGFGRSILIGAEDGTIAGNKTHLAAQKAGIKKVAIIEDAGDTLIVHKRTDVTLESKKGRTLALEDNRSQEVNLRWDFGVVASYGVDTSHLWEPMTIPTFELPPSEEKSPEDTSFSEDKEQETETLESGSVPDAIWPTDNDLGIPVLSKHWQADAIDLPVNAWGASGRKSKMNGTYHFYTDDYRFEALWKDPSPIVNAGCVNIVEPNFSTNTQMPRVVVLWHIYRKRWLARYWQSQGIRVFVDLDVNPVFAEINLLGVPKGWLAYACRMESFGAKPEELDHSLSVAFDRAETEDIIMLVIGGNDTVQEMCKTRPQCTWVASFVQTAFKNIKQKTQGG